jgi:hypothetical protein
MAYYETIHNSGMIIENGIEMTNQCLWISIRDYLRYCRGEEWKVIDIKELGGLGPESDYEMFDWENMEYRTALELITQRLNIRINFFLVDHTGQHHPELYLRGLPIPMHIVNDEIHGTDVVNIAFYGAHFEFIVRGPNIIPCNLRGQPDIGVFQPKVQKKSKSMELIDDSDELTHIYVQIIDNMNQIDINTSNIRDILFHTERLDDVIMSLDSLEIDHVEKIQLDIDYKDQYENLLNSAEKLTNENKQLKARNVELNEIINGLGIEPYPRHHPSEKKLPTTSIPILVYCHPRKINYDDKSSHWWLSNTYADISRKPIMDYILEHNNIKPTSAKFNTVDIRGTPDYITDGFSSEFISQHQNEFDIVLLPDCDGRWWDIINSGDDTEKSILLYSLIENLMTIIKPRGKLYLSKLVFSEKVLKDLVSRLRQFKINRLAKHLIEIIKD